MRLSPSPANTFVRHGAVAPRRALHDLGTRVVDVTVALALLLLTLPVLVLAALAVRLDGPGPVFRPLACIGEDGRVLLLVTFRCTASGTHGPGAPVLSRVGQVLRAVRLDQLPVLFNLLHGDLTLFGPAPMPLAAAVTRAPLAKPGLLASRAAK